MNNELIISFIEEVICCVLFEIGVEVEVFGCYVYLDCEIVDVLFGFGYEFIYFCDLF